MANYQVASDAEFTSALSSLSTGADSIEFLDAGTFTSITIPSTVPTGVTFFAETSQVPTLERLIINKGGIRVDGLKVQVNHDYVAAAESDWHLVEINNLTDYAGLELENLYLRGGYYNAGTLEDFITTAGSAETAYASLIGDLANGIYSGDVGVNNGVNGLTYLPGGIGPGLGGGVRPDGDLLIQGCTITDLKGGIEQRPAMGAGQRILIRKNHFIRSYVDTINLSQPGTTYAGPEWLEITGNEFEDCVWCQPQDNKNPHGEPIQIFGSSGTASQLPGVFIAGNLIWYRPGFRGGGQRFFFSDHNYGYPYRAPVIVDNLVLSRRSTKGIWIEADSPNKTGAVYAYAYRNAPLANPTQQAIVGNAGYTHPSTGVAADAGAAGAAVMTITWDGNFTGKNFLGDNIVEAVSSSAEIDTSHRTNLVLGAASVSNTYSTAYDAPATGWDDLDTAQKTLDAYTPKTAYAAKGPVRSSDTVTTFLDRWSGATKSWSDLPSYVGIANKVRQTANTAVTSDWGCIHAPSGTAIPISGSRTMTPGTGLEWREADDEAGTNATSWSSTAGTVTHGKFLQLRGTSPVAAATTETFTYTIGSEAFTWRVQTESNTAFPLATFDGTQIVRKSTTAWSSATSDKFTLAISWKMPTSGTDKNLLAASPSGEGRLNITARGATKKLSISMTGVGSATAIFSKDITINTAVDDNALHTVLISVDISQATAAAGLLCYVDDVKDTAGAGTWTSPGPFAFANSGMNPQAGGVTNTPNYIGDLAMLWWHPGVALDLDDPDVRNAFDAAYIGPNGEGPMAGTAPEVFMPGVATNFESGDPNLGTGDAWAKVIGTNAITAGNAESWPPTLQLVAEVQTAGPYSVGQPIDVLVYAAGYTQADTITGSTDQTGTFDDSTLDVVAGSNGVTFTYTPGGSGGVDHTLSFASTIGYTAPSNVVLTVQTSGSDTTPNAFDLGDQTDAALSTVYESSQITVSGIDAAANLTITGGEYSINSGGWASSATTVNNGDTVKVRGTSSASFSTAVDVALTIGGVSDTFTITTAAEDTTPAAFDLGDQTGAELSTVYQSNEITVAGINSAADLTITGGEYQINGGAWASTATTVSVDDTVSVRGTSSASYLTAVNVALTIGGVSDTFTITTKAEPVEGGATHGSMSLGLTLQL